MGTLTANLHLMMNSFYKPTPSRYKILCEAHAFPSDQVWPIRRAPDIADLALIHDTQYAFASQALHYDLNPEDAILELNPRLGEFTLREEDILDALSQHGHQIALVMFSGVQYYTGQLFPIEKITRKGHEMVCPFS